MSALVRQNPVDVFGIPREHLVHAQRAQQCRPARRQFVGDDRRPRRLRHHHQIARPGRGLQHDIARRQVCRARRQERQRRRRAELLEVFLLAGTLALRRQALQQRIQLAQRRARALFRGRVQIADEARLQGEVHAKFQGVIGIARRVCARRLAAADLHVRAIEQGARLDRPTCMQCIRDLARHARQGTIECRCGIPSRMSSNRTVTPVRPRRAWLICP